MAAGDVTEAHLIDALQRALEEAERSSPYGAMSTRDIQEALDWTEKKVHHALHMLKRMGRLECVRIVRRNIAGVNMPVPAYRLRQGDGEEG